MFQTVCLKDLCQFLNGGTPSKAKEEYFNGETPWITSADIVGSVADQARSFITDNAIKDSATNKVSEGTVLLVTRTGVGKVAVAGFDLCFSQDITAIIPAKEKLFAGYLVHFLKTKQKYFLSLARGATIQGITRNVVAELEIPLPQLPEQRRIAAILDQADQLRVKRREALAELDRLTQSIFVEMFGDLMDARTEWEIQPISYFVSGFESGKSVVADDEDEIDSKYKVLKVSAVTSLEYRPHESKAVPSDYVPQQSYFVKAGDLLFSRANTTELIGATAYVSNTPENMLLSDKLWRFVWHETPRAEKQFVNYLFRQKKFRAEIGRRASGTSGSMKNISQEKVLTIRIGLPSLELQKIFSKRIQSIETIKINLKKAALESDTLFTSLQHRAFRGEL